MVREGLIQRKLQPAGQIDYIITQVTYFQFSDRMNFINTKYVFYIGAHAIVKLSTLCDSHKRIHKILDHS